MWTLKIETSSMKGIVGPLVVKHKVIVHIYPISYNKVSDTLLVHFAGVVKGRKENIARFIKELSGLSQVRKIETNDNFVLCLYEDSAMYEAFYNPELIFLEPWVIDGVNKINLITLGAWNRKYLTKVLDVLKKNHYGKLLRIFNKKISNFFVTSYYPQLTEKQKEAMELAIKEGYYDYPRHIKLEELAKMSKLSYSTFQAHLRKAERKLLPHSFHKIEN